SRALADPGRHAGLRRLHDHARRDDRRRRRPRRGAHPHDARTRRHRRVLHGPRPAEVTRGIERELKLLLPDEAAWEALRATLGPPRRVIRQVNTYFDTRDRRLTRTRRLMVRVREESEADGREHVEVTAKDRTVVDPATASLRTRERT